MGFIKCPSLCTEPVLPHGFAFYSNKTSTHSNSNATVVFNIFVNYTISYYCGNIVSPPLKLNGTILDVLYSSKHWY